MVADHIDLRAFAHLEIFNQFFFEVADHFRNISIKSPQIFRMRF